MQVQKQSRERESHITYRGSKTSSTRRASTDPFIMAGSGSGGTRPEHSQKSSKILKCWYNEPFFPCRGAAHPLRSPRNSLTNSCRFYHYERYSNLSRDSQLKKNEVEWSEIGRNSHKRSEKTMGKPFEGNKKWPIRVCGLLKQIQAC